MGALGKIEGDIMAEQVASVAKPFQFYFFCDVEDKTFDADQQVWV